MKLTGSYQINLEKQKVWESLNDPKILKQAIPGCEEFKKNSDTEFTAIATNKIGPFNASFTGDIELKDLNPPNSYKITGSGNSPVGFASGEATVSLEDYEGGTISISNLGMFGIDEFSAIINPPQSCILAVGTITTKPGIIDNHIVPVNVLKSTLSADHRILDGAIAVKLLKDFNDIIEDPFQLWLISKDMEIIQ